MIRSLAGEGQLEDPLGLQWAEAGWAEQIG
jgi:hypothetical protein